MFKIHPIFIEALYGQKNIYIIGDPNNKLGKNKFIYICGKLTCDNKTIGVSERADIGLKEIDNTINYNNVSSFRIDTSYIQNDLEQNFNKLLNGLLEIYLITGPNNHIGQGKYISLCGVGPCNTINLSVSNDVRDSRLYLEIDGLTGDLKKDIERTFLGKNTVRFRIKNKNNSIKLGKYIGICGKNSCGIDNLGTTYNKNLASFRLNVFHPLKLNCCKNIGNTLNCNEFWGDDGTGKCDKMVMDYCSIPTNKDDPDCVCINSTIYPPECLDKRCMQLNRYRTKKMILNKCENVDMSCGYYKNYTNKLKKNILNYKKLNKKCYKKKIYQPDNNTHLIFFILGICIIFIYLFGRKIMNSIYNILLIYYLKQTEY